MPTACNAQAFLFVPLALLDFPAVLALAVLSAILGIVQFAILGTKVLAVLHALQDITQPPQPAQLAQPSTATASPAAEHPLASLAPRDSPQRACVLIATLPTILLAETV